jgi:hypothetical protein
MNANITTEVSDLSSISNNSAIRVMSLLDRLGQPNVRPIAITELLVQTMLANQKAVGGLSNR